MRNQNRLWCTTAGSTLRALDGYGLRDTLPARPALAPRIRFLFIGSHLCSTLPSDPASRRQPLRFANPSPPSGWVEDFHLRAIEHARHTTRTAIAAASSRTDDQKGPDDPDIGAALIRQPRRRQQDVPAMHTPHLGDRLRVRAPALPAWCCGISLISPHGALISLSAVAALSFGPPLGISRKRLAAGQCADHLARAAAARAACHAFCHAGISMLLDQPAERA
jgi:hypothetical protein